MWSSKLNDTRLFRSKQLLLMYTDCTVLVMHHKFWSIPMITHVMPIARHAWDLGKLQMIWKVLSISAAIWCKGLGKNKETYHYLAAGFKEQLPTGNPGSTTQVWGVQLYIVQWTISAGTTLTSYSATNLLPEPKTTGGSSPQIIMVKKTTISHHQPKISNLYIYIYVYYLHIYTCRILWDDTP